MLEGILRALKAPISPGNYDVAAGVNESTLNAYAVAHFNSEHPKAKNPYKGEGEIPDLRLGYQYDIAKPAIFDLTPSAKFDASMSRWLLRQPELLQNRSSAALRELLAKPQPNISLLVPDIVLTLVMETIHKQIQLSFSLSVTCFVTTDSSNQLRITPISATIDDPKALDKAILDAAKRAGIDPGHKDATCYELAELVKYIINNTLADRISQFVVSIPLPSFINVFDGVTLGNLQILIIEKFIVATAFVSVRSSKVTESLVSESVNLKADAKMLAALGDARHNSMVHGAQAMSIQAARDPNKLPGHGFFLLMTQALFQKLADKFIQYNDGSEKCGTFLGIFEGCVGWFLRIWNPRVQIQNANLLVDFDFKGGGYAKARAHLHCGPTPWVQVSITADANPARLITSFFVSGTRTIGMSAGARPFTINWHVQGLPFPIDQIIAAILDILSDVAIYVVSVLGLRWNRNLVDIPAQIPGTGVTATPSIDSSIANYNGDLAVTGTVAFH